MPAQIIRPDQSFLMFDLTDEEHHQGDLEVTKYPVEEGPDVADNVRLQPREFHLTCTISNSPIHDYNKLGGRVTNFPITGAGPSPKTQLISGLPASLDPLADAEVGGLFAALSAVSGAIGSLFAGSPTKYSVNVLAWATPFDMVITARDNLDEMQQNAELLTVVTSKYVYNGYVLSHWDETRNVETGDGALFNLTFTEISQVTVSLTAAPVTEPRGQAPVAKGAKGVKAADDAQIKSLLAHGSDKVNAGGIFKKPGT